jgi:glycogen debranching enzyme
MIEGWTFTGEPVNLEQPGGQVTIVQGSSFSLSGRAGDIRPGSADGLFVLDTRVISGWALLIDGRPLEPLSVSVTEPYAATFVARIPPPAGSADGTLLVVRKRWVGSGMREDLEIRNFSSEPEEHLVELLVESDLADLFAVKAGRLAPDPLDRVHHLHPLHTAMERGGVRREVRVTECCTADLGDMTALGLAWQVTVPPKGSWSTCLEVEMSVDGRPVPLQYSCGEAPTQSPPSRRLAQWRERTPRIVGDDDRLTLAVSRAVVDIGSLIIEDPAHPDATVVAAGAPWFMALFGRDSLLTSYMCLVADSSLAVGVLQTLARLQGERVDLVTEEQPGRILHEVRFSTRGATGANDGHVYYGSVDATPLFVVLLGELSRWGVARPIVDALLVNADRALAWIEQYGDRDGDGYVEYERMSPAGLANQAWKDSWDGVGFADGRLADTPIAMAEVQGYVYAAYQARADLADERGDQVTSARCRSKAAELRQQFNQDFWLPDRGWYALALDGSKRPVDALASNIGHCLWSGIVDDEHAQAVADRLASAEMASGWGLRTLSTTMRRYNPLSYHNGSVWPHDTAIAAAGLMRYGCTAPALSLINAVLDAAAANGGRLPELYAGLDRAELPVPVAYPTSCSPQAWAAAAPLLMLRTLLRLEPRLDLGYVTADPVPTQAPLRNVELALGGSRVRLSRDLPAGGDDAAPERWSVSGLPTGVEFEQATHRSGAGRDAQH